MQWLFMPTVIITDDQTAALVSNVPADASIKTLIDDAIWQSCRGGRMWNKPWSDEPTTRNVNMIAAGAVSELQNVILMVPTAKHADKERLLRAFHEAYPHVRVEAVEEYIPYRQWAYGEEYTSETHTATEHTSYLFLILCFYGVGIICAYQFIGGVFAWLLHIRSLSTVNLPDDAVTTTLAFWLCSYGFPPRSLAPLVRQNAIDDLVTNAMGFDVKRLAYTENRVSVNTSSSNHPRSADVATNAREWLNAARCLKVYNDSLMPSRNCGSCTASSMNTPR
jgi:hypothetical protein